METTASATAAATAQQEQNTEKNVLVHKPKHLHSLLIDFVDVALPSKLFNHGWVDVYMAVLPPAKTYMTREAGQHKNGYTTAADAAAQWPLLLPHEPLCACDGHVRLGPACITNLVQG